MIRRLLSSRSTGGAPAIPVRNSWDRGSAFDQSVAATGIYPNPSDLAGVVDLLAELEILALPLTVDLDAVRS